MGEQASLIMMCLSLGMGGVLEKRMNIILREGQGIKHRIQLSEPWYSCLLARVFIYSVFQNRTLLWKTELAILSPK